MHQVVSSNASLPTHTFKYYQARPLERSLVHCKRTGMALLLPPSGARQGLPVMYVQNYGRIVAVYAFLVPNRR